MYVVIIRKVFIKNSLNVSGDISINNKAINKNNAITNKDIEFALIRLCEVFSVNSFL